MQKLLHLFHYTREEFCMKTLHSFEVPLFVEPSQHFRRFINEIIPLDVSSIFASYWQDKLTFTFRSDDNKERTASLRPFPINFDIERKTQLQKTVSSFASKFNCSMSLVGEDCKVRLFLITDSMALSEASYDDKPIAILKATVACSSVPAEIALANFCTVIDMSSSNG